VNNQSDLVLRKSFLVPGAHSDTERTPELQSSTTLASPPLSYLGTIRDVFVKQAEHRSSEPRSSRLHIAVGTRLREAQARHLLTPPLSHTGKFLSSKSNICRAFQKPNMVLHKPCRGVARSPGFHCTGNQQSLRCSPVRHRCTFASLEARPTFPRRLSSKCTTSPFVHL